MESDYLWVQYVRSGEEWLGCPLDQNAEPIRFFPLERDSRTKNIIQGILCWVEMACPLMTSLLSHFLRTLPREQREDNPKERWLRLREQLNAARHPHTCVWQMRTFMKMSRSDTSSLTTKISSYVFSQNKMLLVHDKYILGVELLN